MVDQLDIVGPASPVSRCGEGAPESGACSADARDPVAINLRASSAVYVGDRISEAGATLAAQRAVADSDGCDCALSWTGLSSASAADAPAEASAVAAAPAAAPSGEREAAHYTAAGSDHYAVNYWEQITQCLSVDYDRRSLFDLDTPFGGCGHDGAVYLRPAQALYWRDCVRSARPPARPRSTAAIRRRWSRFIEAKELCHLSADLKPSNWDLDWLWPSSYAISAAQTRETDAWLNRVQAWSLLDELSTGKSSFWSAANRIGSVDRSSRFIVDGQHRLSAVMGLQLSAAAIDRIVDRLRDLVVDRADVTVSLLKRALDDLILANARRQPLNLPRPSLRVASLVHDQILSHQLSTGVPPPRRGQLSLSPVSNLKEHARAHLRSPRPRYLGHPRLRGLAPGRRGTRLSPHPPAAQLPLLGRCGDFHRRRPLGGRSLHCACLRQVGPVLRMDRLQRPGTRSRKGLTNA